MAYFEKTGIYATDSPSIDAFGRWRTSTPRTIFDSKLLTQESLNIYWSQRTWENATSSYNAYQSLTIMGVGTSSGSRAIDQTIRRFVYEPGKSLLIIVTGLFGNYVDGIEKYMLYGDDYYGLGFCQSGSSFGVIKRNTNSETTTVMFVSQSEWNLDTYDGNGPSGNRYDVSKCQIHFIDMEWLGVGRVRYGIFQGGKPTYVHEFGHINELVAPYINNPNLPVRYEIVNKIGSSVTSSMKHICCSIVSEGGTDNLGIQWSIDSGSGSVSVGVGPVIGLLFVRQVTGSISDGYKANSSRILPAELSIFPDGNSNVKWGLYVNPIVNNSGSLRFDRILSSSIEYATGSVNTNLISLGRSVSLGYIPGGTTQAGSNNLITNLDPFFSLGEDLYGNRDVFVLAVQNIEGGTIPCYAHMSFKEVL
jgi:hypothetical protein